VTETPLFVIALRCGRLANRMVLFANFIALVEERGGRLVNFTFHSYADSFQATRRDIYCQYPAPRAPGLLDLAPLARVIKKTRVLYHSVRALGKLNQRFPVLGRTVVTLREAEAEGTTSLETTATEELFRGSKAIFVYGWKFRAPEYVKRHAEKIRQFFKPVEELDQLSRQAVERLREQAEVVVGVHIRHGDYPTLNGGQFFFPISRYLSWMQELEALFPGKRVSFLVCSDEPRREGEFPGLSVGFGPGSAVTDLYALAYCDYIMGPMSTFSQWSSFYGNTPLFHIMGSEARIELDRFTVSFLAEIP